MNKLDPCGRCQHSRYMHHDMDGACAQAATLVCRCPGFKESDWKCLLEEVNMAKPPNPREDSPSEDLWPIAVCKSGYGKEGPYYMYAFCKTIDEARRIQNIYSPRGPKDGLWHWRIWDRQGKQWVPEPVDPRKVMDAIGG